MSGRRFVWLILGLSLGLMTISFSGCTGPPPPDEGPGEEEAPDEGVLGPFFGQVGGVDRLTLLPEEPGRMIGHVYDAHTGVPLEDAVVTATCVRQGLPPLEGTPEVRSLLVGGNGGFGMLASAAFADCIAITYDVAAPGYAVDVPLQGGPLVPGAGYVVWAAMVAR